MKKLFQVELLSRGQTDSVMTFQNTAVTTELWRTHGEQGRKLGS